MGKNGRGRGHSSSSRGRVRSPGFGRIKKSSVNDAKTPAILAPGMDPSKLHPLYVPRSPVRTRAVTKTTGNPQQQQQQQPGIGEPSSSKTGSSAIETSNDYELLSDDDDGNGDENKSDNGLPGNNKQGETKKMFRSQPPIIVPHTLSEVVDNALMPANCDHILRLQKDAVTVVTLTRPNYDTALATLKKANIKYYTYDTPDKVPVKIVLSGYAAVTIPQLLDDLERYKINPREAKVLSRKTSTTGEHVLYLLYFNRGSVKIQDLRKIKCLLGFLINWRYFTKRSSDAAQCHRCQRFGHGSRNCTLSPKCVKCGGAHPTNECTLPQKATLGINNNAEQHKQQVKCTNCDGNHLGV